MHELLLTIEDLKELFFDKNSRVDNDYISTCIKEYFPKVKRYKNDKGKEVTKRYKIPHWTNGIDGDFVPDFIEKIGRPHVFKATDVIESFEILHFKQDDMPL